MKYTGFQKVGWIAAIYSRHITAELSGEADPCLKFDTVFFKEAISDKT